MSLRERIFITTRFMRNKPITLFGLGGLGYEEEIVCGIFGGSFSFVAAADGGTGAGNRNDGW